MSRSLRNDSTSPLSSLRECPASLIEQARYGVVVRPPDYGWDGNHFFSDHLLDAVLPQSLAESDGVILVREGDFVAVVAKTLAAARNAARQLHVRWQGQARPDVMGSTDLATDLRVDPRRSNRHRSEHQGVSQQGSQPDDFRQHDVHQHDVHQHDVHQHEYAWPSRMGWGETPGWTLADHAQDSLRLWGATATPSLLLQDLALASGIETHAISLFADHPEHPCAVGRHCGDDAGVDAALMSRAVGGPVAVWLDASYLRDVHRLGQSQRMSLGARRDCSGTILHYSHRQAHLCGDVPAVGLLLCGRLPQWRGEPATDGADEASSSHARQGLSEDAISSASESNSNAEGRDWQQDGMSLVTPYDFVDETLTVRNQGVSAGSAFRGLGDMQQVFARESFLDEVAHAGAEDPIALRLAHVSDLRGSELIRSVAERAGWRKAQPEEQGATARPQDRLSGRGFAYSQRPDAHQDLASGTRSAWIADVDVNRVTGDVTLTRLVVGQDAGAQVDTAGLQHALQTRVLGERIPVLGYEPAFDEWGDGASPDNSGIEPMAEASSRELRAAEDVMPPAPRQGVDSSILPAFVDLAPGVAVIANALFDATGIRFRQPPFTASRVRAALAGNVDQSQPAEQNGMQQARIVRRENEESKGRSWLKGSLLTVAAGAIAGTAVMAWPWKGAIAPVTRPAANLYSAETLERGRRVAAAGDCAACHTREGGSENAGGRLFDTPFGTIYSTNLTPDEATGIGQWSYAAFERAMRHGISREGHNLYPAFPYTAFAKTSDADMQALYAYLMAQPAVTASVPDNALKFPFNQRALIAGWNMLYHDAAPFTPDPAQSELYNRGAYLSEGLGHCSACHTPRNALGAERGGEAYFAGAMIDGWEAPALNALNRSPVGWSEASLYEYLREGKAELHGVASGPMAPVVAGLAQLPEYDVRAIAHYVATQMNAPAADAQAVQQDAAVRVASSQLGPPGMEAGERLFDGACAACHVEQQVPSFSSATTALTLNTNLHSTSPDNTIQSILGGVHAPTAGNMPGFADSFSDTQITTLAHYLRARFAPEAATWKDVEQRVSAIREEHRSASSTPFGN